MTDATSAQADGDRAFLVSLQRRLAEIDACERDIDARLAATRATLEQLKAERAALEKERAEIAVSAKLYARHMGLTVEALPEPVQARTAAAAGSIPELAQRYLEEHGGRAKVTEIVAALRAVQKLRGPAKNHYPTVFAILRRDPRFKRGERGEFVLASR